MPSKLKRLKINETSFVDKGANPGAFVMLFKRDDKEIPFEDIEAVQKAFEIQFKKDDFNQIMERMTNYDSMHEVMEDIFNKTPLLVEAVESVFSDDTVTDKVAAIDTVLTQYQTSIMECLNSLAKSAEGNDDLNNGDTTMPDDINKELQSQVEALTKKVDDLTKEYDAVKAENEELKKAAKTSTDDDTNINKSELSPEIRAHIEKLEAGNDASSARIAKLEEDAAIKKYDTIAASLNHLPISAIDLSKMILKFDSIVEKSDSESFLDMLDKLNSLAESAMNQNGSDAVDSGNSTLDQLNKKAEEIRKREGNGGLTFEQAFVKATEECPQLYNQYKLEKRGTTSTH